MSNALVPVEAIQTMARAVAASNLFGIKTPEQAMALMLVAQAEGLHPAIAARDYHIIEGKPALKADAMLARFQGAGGKVRWTCMTDDRVAGVFSHPQGGEVEIEWTMAMAQRARLSTKTQRDGGPNMWQKFPRQMLRARVISEGIRATFPGATVGMYTPEEVVDFEPAKDASPETMRDVTPRAEPEAPQKTAAPAPKGGAATTAGEWAEKAAKVVQTQFDTLTGLDAWERRNADLIDRLKREDADAHKKLSDVIAARRGEIAPAFADAAE
jgi:hypothetical protein